MNLRTLLFSISTLFFLQSCHSNKLEQKYLTTENVKRNITVCFNNTNKPTFPQDTTSPKTVAIPSTPKTTVTPPSPSRDYHIIAASQPSLQLAKESAEYFKTKGLQQVNIIFKNNRYRISIGHHPNKEKALRQLDSLIQILNQKDLWLTRY